MEISPDLTSLGKYICGGMTAGAFGWQADQKKRYDPRQTHGSLGLLQHSGTYNNNVISLRAGIAGLGEVYTADGGVCAERARRSAAGAVERVLLTGGCGATGNGDRVDVGVPCAARNDPDAGGAGAGAARACASWCSTICQRTGIYTMTGVWPHGAQSACWKGRVRSIGGRGGVMS